MPRPPNGWLRARGPAISCSSYGSHSSAAVRRALDDAFLSRWRCPLQMNYASSKSNGAGVSDGRASATSVQIVKNGVGEVAKATPDTQ
jgi:hypothetical protein